MPAKNPFKRLLNQDTNFPLPGFIDIHCHILPAIDDGPEEEEESVEMAQLAKDDGITHIFATPHIMIGSYENTATTIGVALERFLPRVPEGIAVFSGADVRISADLAERLDRKEIPTLGGSPYLLLELPSYAMPLNMEAFLFALRRKEYIPVITHPERYGYFAANLSKLAMLRDEGALVQITASSVTGDFGRDIKKTALMMTEKNLVDFVATDSHGVRRRRPILSKAYREIARQFDRTVADRLFYHNPRKILDATVSAGDN